MKIALVGNQNSGKTTLFNLLTGMNAKIGNWPGVTIEKKTGLIRETEHEITDLPGIYSLSPYSVEEDVSRNYIFDESPDVIINIVDSTILERSMYLTTQLLELDSKVIIALNMADVLEKKGIKIDIEKLEKQLGAKVVKISALKETGIDELISQIDKLKNINKNLIYDEKLENGIFETEKILPKNQKHRRFVAVKILEDDKRFINLQNEEITKIKEQLSKNYDTDLEEIIAEERYKFIEKVKKETFVKGEAKETISDKLDKVFLNKYFAFPIFVIIMFLVYFLSVGVIGSFTVDWIGKIVDQFGENLEDVLTGFGTSEWLVSLVVKGIVQGVGAVLGFVPQLIILFICISILETTGYMSRIALFLDKIFRKIGLSGKSLIPFIVGSGCSVPGIMGTRIIENQDEREMTTILTPFIPCSAKLPIIALFSGYFFGEYSGIVSASLYFLAIFIIIFTAILLKKFIYKNTSNTYISELPEYKLPSIKYVAKDVWDKVISFIKRAGSVILICSIVIWFLLSFSFKMEYGVDVEGSILATIGKKVSFVFYPMLGENSWGATVSAVQGLVAKEQVISSMSVIAGFGEEETEGSQIFSKESIFGFFTPISAYAFMIFNLFSAPCFGAIGAMRRELGGRKKMLKAIVFQTIYAWILATAFYQVGSRIANRVVNVADVVIVLAIVAVVVYIIVKKRNKKECASCPYCDSCNKSKS